MDENLTNMNSPGSSQGILTVQVSEAEKAIPVRDALALVTRDNPDGSVTLYGVLTTDESGITPELPLPAPAAGESMTPSNTSPYSIYYVRISHPGYYTEENHMIQVFGDSKSNLRINLIPLPEFPEKDVISY